MVKYTINPKNKVNFSLKEKILKYLIENKTPASIMKISKEVNTDYKNTFNVIDNFSSEIIYKNKLGNTNLIEIRLSPNLDIYLVESKRTEEFLKENKELALIKKDAENLNYPFFIILIFGSFVKKTNVKNSDIDICIISDNQNKTEELISKIKLLPLNLEIHYFNIKEFESMLEKKENNLGKEIVKNNIILYGRENYYNLISKWMKKG
ncbi:nucleotidyltransferase domain-containing protein [Candidatus Pacearchaeota archaeon]|nr:nucleotidyltransferase domain-containing protein [Candidatus Pacearchaeota archaeon]